MIVNCRRRGLLVFELPTPRQLCSNGSPWPSEEVPDELYHSLSVDISNIVWAQRRLINKLSGNTFGTGPSNKVIIGAEQNHSTIFGSMPKIRAQMVQTIVLYLAPLPGFDPKNPQRSHKQDSTLPSDGTTFGTMQTY